MKFEKVLQLRRYAGKCLPKQISGEQLQTLWDSASRAPVGNKLYKDIHITVVQGQEILLKLCEVLLDLVMSVIMPFLMAYRAAGEKAHEWLGIAMFAATAVLSTAELNCRLCLKFNREIV